MRRILITLFFTSNILLAKAQDFVRAGAIHDFSNNKVLSTFSFAFNRTEAEEPDVAKYLYYNAKNKLFLLPTSEFNIGDGVSSSENNVLVQIKFGRVYLPLLKTNNANPLLKYVIRQSIELNPSFNSDKDFKEQLYYGQIRYGINYVSQLWSGTIPGTSYIKTVQSIAIGPYANFGARNSVTYNQSKAYITAGTFLEYKFRSLNATADENWTGKLSGNYYYILSDVDAITNDQFGGIIKASLDRRIYKKFALGVEYKYGNDNPKYAYVHSLGISAKVSY